MSYCFDGPVSFSSMTAQAFLHFGFHHEQEEKARWRFVLRESAGGWEASLVCEGRSAAGPQRCRSRREAAHFLMDALALATGRTLGRWGYLLGMRPVKALYPYLQEEGWEERARAFLKKEKVTEETAHLLLAAAGAHRRLLEEEGENRGEMTSLYVHIPFCPSHCVYCSFPSAVMRRGAALDGYTEALCGDIRRAGELIRRKGLAVESIYFGGGTPTILTEAQMARVLAAVRDAVPQGVREWTVEAGRPDTVNPSMLALLRSDGVDRISINPQTMQDPILARISRTHGGADVFRAFKEARAAGFHTINMDFICGLPSQTVRDMAENLRVICQLRPENVTIHTLAVKRGSPFFQREKEWDLPKEPAVEAMLRLAGERLRAAGYHPYYLYRQKYMADDFANVGWALPGHDSVYNIQMIGERQHVVGAGAGSVSKAVLPGGFRLKKLYMPKEPRVYGEMWPSLCGKREALWDFLPDGGDLQKS